MILSRLLGKNAAIIFTMRVGADLSCHYQYPLCIILEKEKIYLIYITMYIIVEYKAAYYCEEKVCYNEENNSS